MRYNEHNRRAQLGHDIDVVENFNGSPWTLCGRCSRISFRDLEEASSKDRPYEHSTLRDLQATSRSCPLCRLIYIQIQDSTTDRIAFSLLDPLAKVLLSAARTRVNGRRIDIDLNIKPSIGIGASWLKCYADPSSCDESIDIPRGRMIDEDPSSEKIMQYCNNLINECRTNHPNCSREESGTTKSVDMPTRVLDVGFHDKEVKLFTSGDCRAEWVALSHCWGTGKLFTLLTSNLCQLEQTVPLHLLSPVFRDAISLTRRLGIRYLWIDSLCIVQDDPMDWSRESVMMQHVYGHAYCVVSSCSSSDDKGRLFSPREPFDVAQIPLAPGHREQLNVRLRDADNHALWEFQGSPITTRAWTLQERLLAKRILHFHEHRIYFECATTFISEEGEQLGGFIQFKWTGTQTWVNIVQRAEESARDLVKENLAAGSYDLQWKPESYKSTGRFSDFWCLTVEEYTQRALTKTSDKLAAIDGLAQQIQSRSGKRYCAGIWLDSAYNELGWAIVNGQPSKSNRAPSWSWASIDGEVEWGYRNLPLLNKIPALKIHDWDLRRMVASGRTKQALILAPTDQTISEEIGTGDLDDQDSGPLWSMMSLDSDVSKDLNARSDIGQKTTAIPVTCFQISVFKSSKNRDRWFLGEFRPPHYMVSQVLLLEQVQAPGSRIPNFKRVGSGCIQDEFWFKDVADTELTVL